MVGSWMKTVIIYVVSIAAVAVLGIWLGTMYGSYRAEAEQAKKKAAYQDFFEKNLVGINLGLPFPNISVEAPGGRGTYTVSELLPQGGLLIYLASGCESCNRTIETLLDALDKTGGDARRILLVTFQNPEALMEELSRDGIEAPIYHDFDATMLEDFGVVTLPTTFLLDEDGIVRRMVAGMESSAEFVDMLQQ